MRWEYRGTIEGKGYAIPTGPRIYEQREEDECTIGEAEGEGGGVADAPGVLQLDAKHRRHGPLREVRRSIGHPQGCRGYRSLQRCREERISHRFPQKT